MVAVLLLNKGNSESISEHLSFTLSRVGFLEIEVDQNLSGSEHELINTGGNRTREDQNPSESEPKWIRARVDQNPSGSETEWIRARVDQNPSGSEPEWIRARVDKFLEIDVI